jgi:purine-nucleoside/S-methyl-5'-thioadenosine phosphorylase / adenosine deaminase
MSGMLEVSRRDDLGGGFHYTRLAAGGAVIVCGALANVGMRALMSPAPLNARERDAFHHWVSAACASAASRLRGVDQVHGANVVRAASLRDGRRVEADGVLAADAQDAVVIMAADCAPVWLFDPATQIVALLHAGWRGVAAGVIEAGVRAAAESGASAQRLVAAIGPHLQACCFEVGPEVAAQFPGHTRPAATLVIERHRNDSVALDLSSAIEARLRAVHVRNIHTALACTHCRADILHSYRRNGKGGPLMGAIGFAGSGLA